MTFTSFGQHGRKYFWFSRAAEPACPVGGNIHNILDSHLADAQKAFEQKLATVKFSDLAAELKKAESAEK
ncbi:MAG: hypothetical protein L6V90_10870 [Treponema succinifaciens]|nr:MAG: hypothetical protein L6V90_10870 [Treponema succinifaciens]